MVQSTVEGLRPLLESRIREATAGIVGVGGQFVSAIGSDRFAKVTINMDGWSPSLHKVRIARDVEVRLHDDLGTRRGNDELADEILRPLPTIVDLQRERAAAAQALGQHRQFGLKHISHLQAERAWPVLKELAGGIPRRSLAEAVRRAHSGGGYPGGRQLAASGIVMAEGLADDGTIIRAALPQIKLKSPCGRRAATWRGFEIEVHAPPPPDAVMASLAGRPMGDLVELHPLVDVRTIHSARAGGWSAKPTIVLTIGIETDPVDELMPPCAEAA